MSELRIDQLITRHVGPIDLRVEAGECVCIEGASGCGKSLLLRAIADLDLHTGEARVDGLACAALPPRSGAAESPFSQPKANGGASE